MFRHILLAASTLALSMTSFAQNVGIGTNTPKSLLEVNGTFGTVIGTYTNTTTALNLESTPNYSTILASAGVTIDLPVNSTSSHRVYTIVYNSSSGSAVTIAPNGSDVIWFSGSSVASNSSPYSLTSGSLSLQSDGAGKWYVYAKNTVTGPTGPTGPTGAAGSNGSNGTNGATGATGPTGAAGTAGSNGSNGTNGATGATGAGYTATSTTSIAIGTGSKAFATQTGLAYLSGDRVRVSNSSSNYMEGVVSTYASGTLTVTIDLAIGSGTLTSWNIGLAGAIGTTGATGSNGTNGATGATGAAGNNGTNGATGATGPTGPTGFLSAGSATGNIPYWSGSAWVYATPSAAGQILTSNGTSNVPEWQSLNGLEWGLTGNSSTNTGKTVGVTTAFTAGTTNALGTSDTNNLLFEENGKMAGLIDQSINGLTYYGYQTTSATINTNGIDNTAFGADALYTTISNPANNASSKNGYQNTAVGYGALFSNGYAASTNGGYKNTAIGVNALAANTSGYSNAALGASALYSNTTGNDNMAVGTNALYSTTSGTDNVAIGVGALYVNQTGFANVAIGTEALYNNTGTSNIAIGYLALVANQGGNQNTANGQGSLSSNTTGGGNVAIGYSSLLNNTTQSSNTAVGTDAMYYMEGSNNTAIGWEALVGAGPPNGNTNYALNTGSYNTAIGMSALGTDSSGGSNVAIGYQAADSNTSGNNNTFIGYYAGITGTPANANKTGSNNTFIGYESGPGVTTQLTNATAIGYNALVSTSNSLVLGNGASVGIGTSSPTQLLHVNNGNVYIANTNNTAGELIFQEPSTSGTNYTAFKAQAQSGNVTYTLPAADGTASGQVLTTNGAGTLSWNTVSSTGVSSITGTTNEVIASASTGAVTLSLPQDIATTSSPTFANLNINDTLNTNAAVSYAVNDIATSGTTVTLNNTEYCVIFTGTHTQTVALPTAGTAFLGRVYLIVNQSTQTMTISNGFDSGSGGGNTTTIAAGANAQLICDGSVWRKIN